MTLPAGTKRDKALALLKEKPRSFQDLMSSLSSTRLGVVCTLHALRKRLKGTGKIELIDGEYHYVPSSTPAVVAERPSHNSVGRLATRDGIPNKVLNVLINKAPKGISAPAISKALQIAPYNVYWAISRLRADHRIVVRNKGYRYLGLKSRTDATVPAKKREMVTSSANGVLENSAVAGASVEFHYAKGLGTFLKEEISPEDRDAFYDLMRQAIFYDGCVRAFLASHAAIVAIRKEVGDAEKD